MINEVLVELKQSAKFSPFFVKKILWKAFNVIKEW